MGEYCTQVPAQVQAQVQVQDLHLHQVAAGSLCQLVAHLESTAAVHLGR